MIWIDCCPGFLFIAMINTNTKNNLGRKGFPVYRPSVRDRAGAQGRHPEAGSEAEVTEAECCLLVCSLVQPAVSYHEGPPTQGWHHPL